MQERLGEFSESGDRGENVFSKTGDGASWAWKADNSSRLRGEPRGRAGVRHLPPPSVTLREGRAGARTTSRRHRAVGQCPVGSSLESTPPPHPRTPGG